MATKRPTGARSDTIHCEFCGEDYAATYKHCPFCNDRPSAEDCDEGDERRGGGKRLVHNTRGGGYGGSPSPFAIIGTVLCIALIVAAVCIVISIIKPMIDRGKTPPIDPNTPPSQSQAVSPPAGPTGTTPPAAESPAATIPADQTATAFSLDKPDFTMTDKWPDPVLLKVTFSPAGSTGSITWTSSDPAVASVDEKGLVSPGTKNGSTTITATMAGGYQQVCVVRCNLTGASGGTAPGTTPGTAALALNHTDFTFSGTGDASVQMKVSGTSSTPVWSIGNAAVATISSGGLVSPAGHGSTTITCTVDGKTLTCVVRCTF